MKIDCELLMVTSTTFVGMQFVSYLLLSRGRGPELTSPLWALQFQNPLILLLLASAFVSVLMRQFDDAFSIAAVSSAGFSYSGSNKSAVYALQYFHLFWLVATINIVLVSALL